MDWNSLFSPDRFDTGESSDLVRTSYQRDYDRIIFSSEFRRLQNKTQIFPLPGSTFVHNRLTHSLETASVGRSLGQIVGSKLVEGKFVEGKLGEEFYRFEFQNVIAAACLAHDIGNPPFGHSGEEAISSYFRENESTEILGKKLKDYYSDIQWTEMNHFEGNANSFRILTRQVKGHFTSGFNLTYTTLAAVLKYPCSASIPYPPKSEKEKKKKSSKEQKGDESSVHRKKYSFFEADKDNALKVINKFGMKKVDSQLLEFKRHPFVFLTEAADDICYRIVDYEDAYRLKLISYNEISDKFGTLVKEFGGEKESNRVKRKLNEMEDEEEKVALLRAKAINFLTLKASEIFLDRQKSILEGKFDLGLIDFLEKDTVLEEIAKNSREKIYNHHSVVRLEIAGLKVMSYLLSLFIPAVLKPEDQRDHQDRKTVSLLPQKFRPVDSGDGSHYLNTLSVLDYFASMTDPYIIEFYRQLSGIEIPKHY